MKEPFKSILDYDLDAIHMFVESVPREQWGNSESGRTPMQVATDSGSAIITVIFLYSAPDCITEISWSYESLLQKVVEEFSQETLCSGWNLDIECELWAIINNEYNYEEQDRRDWLPDKTKACILGVAAQAGFWPVWRCEMKDVEVLSIDHWRKIYADWKQSHS